MCLDNNNHSVFKLKYQLVLMTNSLYPIISKEITSRLIEIYERISPRYNISLKKWHCQENIIEIKFTARPNTELSKFINAYKSAASRLVKKEFPHIVDKLHNGQFWNRTFCLTTLDHGVSSTEIKDFIDKQKGNL